MCETGPVFRSNGGTAGPMSDTAGVSRFAARASAFAEATADKSQDKSGGGTARDFPEGFSKKVPKR